MQFYGYYYSIDSQEVDQIAQNIPGRHYRKGMTLLEMFPDDKTAEAWFLEQRWPNGIVCPKCGCLSIRDGIAHPTMPYRCRDCRKFFSLKTGGLMESSKIGYQKWAIAIFILTTGIKGTVQHEATPSPWHHAEIGVVYDSQNP